MNTLVPAAHGFTRLVDMRARTPGVPGLLAGLLFATVVAVSARGRAASTSAEPAP